MIPPKPSRSTMILFWLLAFSALTLSAWEQIFNNPSPFAAAIRLIVAAVAAAAVIGLGVWLSGRTGLGISGLASAGAGEGRAFASRSWFRAAMVVGVGIGGLGLLAMKTVFLSGNSAWRDAWVKEGAWPFWRRLALCYEAGVLEEILFRLVLLSLYVWAFSAIRKTARVRPAVFWAANALAAVLFGLAHLAKPFPLAPVEMAGVLVINGAGAAAFGYLFWKKGLASAILAHMTADLVVRALGHFLV